MEEYEQALSECHSLQQKTEYLLRGYSSQLPGSLVNTNANTNASASTTMVDTKVSPPTNPHEIIKNMIQLLERMEQEGKAYVELRSKYRSQLAHVSGNNDNGKNYHHDDIHIDTDIDIDDDTDIDIDANNDDNDGSGNGTIVDESTNNTAWKMNALVTNFGAPPGPSNTMYDLILDAIAVSISASSAPLELLKMARVVHGRALARYELDVKAGVEQMNPSSCPTPATFNAVIRAAAGISATETGSGIASGIDADTDADAETGIATDTANMENEEVRDYAMENAFFTFDAMHHHPVVHRNSSTYRYMLDMIGVIFPVGEVRGNIAAVMWEKAVQDKVIDVPLFEAMQKVGRAEHGELFDNWWKSTEAKFVKDVNGHGFPMIWGKNKKLRRFDRKLDSY